MSNILPKAPKFSLALIGPGIVLIAMGLGSGEFILWPYLVSQFGFGILWGALVGITCQYFVSNETGRYTLATGGSVYAGFYKLNKYIPYWFIISTYLSFAWPGIILAGGVIFSKLLNYGDPRVYTIAMLLMIGMLLTFGGKVYTNLERVQKIFVLIALPLLLFIAALVIDITTVDNIAVGLVGKGEGYWFIPPGIGLMAFLGSVAYSGAAGNLVASHSFYLQDEGAGAARNFDTQISLKNTTTSTFEGEQFEPNSVNVKNFNHWFKISAIEQFISFWIVGIITIIMLCVIAYGLAYPFNGEEGLNFIFLQSDEIAKRFPSFLGTIFLLIGVIFLFTTQLGIFETTSRIMTENFKLGAKSFTDKLSRSSIYFSFLWLQILSSIFIASLNLTQPIQILIIGTFFSAISMFVLSGLIFKLNTSAVLPEEIQMPFSRKLAVILSFIFFGIFCMLTVLDILGILQF